MTPALKDNTRYIGERRHRMAAKFSPWTDADFFCDTANDPPEGVPRIPTRPMAPRSARKPRFWK